MCHGPLDVLGRLVRRGGTAVTGVENRILTIVSASATPGHADMRRKGDIVVM